MPDHLYAEDTIAAIATPVGQAGIGIVRLSGTRSGAIAERIFRPQRPTKNFGSHRLHLGHVVDPCSEAVIDEVLLSFMKAPHSYTREDVVEINSHSGHLLLFKILQLTLDAGARMARPGEFTFRAFMNGRMDLTQAEAIVDLINSKSEKGLLLASQQLKGGFRTEIEALRQKALDILAHVEVAIDFPEEASDMSPREEAAARLGKDLIEPIERIIAAHAQRRIWLEGISTVIVGRVNAGKSSLLNRLLNEQRALVTPIPGTTRDIIESTVHIEGIPLRLMDTAGFRKVKGQIEGMGIQLAEQKLAEAELALIVVDQSRRLNQDDLNLVARSDRKKSLIILNKIDLPSRLNEGTSEKTFGGYQVVRISALTGEGIDALRKIIARLIVHGEVDTRYTHLAPNLRHKGALMEASGCFKNGLTHSKEGMPLEIIALDLQGGLEALGEIIGETTSEDVLDKIFSEFCIGK